MAAPPNKTPYRPVPSHFTPLSVDVLFYERVNRDTAQWRAVPAYNTAHPNSENWPNHFFVYSEPDDEPGWERWWYVADPALQHLYNFETTANLQTQWPSLTQTYLIERSLYTGPGHTAGITAPPSLGKVWTRMGDAESRIGVDKLDSRFVVLKISYEDITLPLTRQRIENDSGQIVIVEIHKVPVGTAAQMVNAQGYIVEVAPINTQWSLSTKDKVSALMGQGERNYQIHRPWPWPPVLIGLSIRLNVDLSFGYDYVMKSWDDVCLIDVREYWSQTAPALSLPPTMGKTSIVWRGALLPPINIPECLHTLVFIKEEADGNVVQRVYPATAYTNWPATIVLVVSVQPHPQGGFRVTQWTVHSPVGITG